MTVFHSAQNFSFFKLKDVSWLRYSQGLRYMPQNGQQLYLSHARSCALGVGKVCLTTRSDAEVHC